MENDFHVRSESTFFVENSSFPLDRPAANSKLVGPYLFISRAPKKPPSPSDSISLLTLYSGHLISMRVHHPVTAFLSIGPKISISANISRLSIYGSYGATLQQIFFFCSIASMILGALAAMAQTKVKRLLAHRFNWTCRCIRHSFSITQSRVKYIADLGALAKTNPISAITFSITMFSYAGITPVSRFCSKFYLFFAALGVWLTS
ncbi:putative NADH:ubiquinone reductase (H(+)-translocating) (mitochondrion) [Helianthus annuus]|nr:putative NADH:ubiquinone reductase (H(+)-translocating) [Helianthus annuus]